MPKRGENNDGRSIPAPISRRLIAFVIDLIVIYTFLITPFGTVVRKALPDGASDAMRYLAEHPQSLASLNVISFYITIVVLAYFMILQYTIRSTIGMMICRLKVESEFKHVHWWQLFVRNMFMIPMFPFVILWVIEAISLIWTKGQTRTLEKLSKTKTIYAP